MKELTKTQMGIIVQFSKAFNATLNNLTEAAVIYVKAIDKDHAMKAAFAKNFNGIIPAGAWAGLEAVGRKQMHPRIMLGVGRNTGFIKRLPFSDQESIIEGEKVELLATDGTTLKVDAREVSATQSKQLFGGNHIRSLSEQKTFLEDSKRVEENNRVEEAKVVRYRIEKGTVHFSADTVFTMAELIAITAEVSRNK